MNEKQIELIKLLGSKELSFGCWINTWRGVGQFIAYRYPLCSPNFFTVFIDESEFAFDLKNKSSGVPKEDIIGHPVSLEDFCIWLNKETLDWYFNAEGIGIRKLGYTIKKIKYNFILKLLDQREEVLEEIISFIKSSI